MVTGVVVVEILDTAWSSAHTKRLRMSLLVHAGEELPPDKHCTFPGCDHPGWHTTRAHHCKRCSQNHSVAQCPLLHAPTLPTRLSHCVPYLWAANIIPAQFQKMYGCENDCAVCLVNKVNVFLPQCGHICICTECMHKMDTHQEQSSQFKVYDESEIPAHTVREVKQQLFLKRRKSVRTKTWRTRLCVVYSKRLCGRTTIRSFCTLTAKDSTAWTIVHWSTILSQAMSISSCRTLRKTEQYYKMDTTVLTALVVVVNLPLLLVVQKTSTFSTGLREDC